MSWCSERRSPPREHWERPGSDWESHPAVEPGHVEAYRAPSNHLSREPAMNEWKRQTQAIRTQAEASPHREHSVPMFLTSSFVFDDSEEMRAAFAGDIQRNIYSRFTNPNWCDIDIRPARRWISCRVPAVLSPSRSR